MTPAAALESLLRSGTEFALRRRYMDNSFEYEVFGDLALALSGQDVLTGDLTEGGVTEAFEFINGLVTDADADTIELLRSGVFEVLCDTRLGVERARAHLGPAARKIFEEVAADYDEAP